jgi:hypothetical protein
MSRSPRKVNWFRGNISPPSSGSKPKRKLAWRWRRCSYEILVDFNQTTRHYIPDDNSSVTAVGTLYPTMTIPCKTVFDRLTAAPFIMKFHVFYGPRKLVVYTTAYQWNPPWVIGIHPRLEVLIYSLHYSSYSYWFAHSQILNIHIFVHPEDGGKISVTNVRDYSASIPEDSNFQLNAVQTPPHILLSILIIHSIYICLISNLFSLNFC